MQQAVAKEGRKEKRDMRTGLSSGLKGKKMGRREGTGPISDEREGGRRKWKASKGTPERREEERRHPSNPLF